MTHAINLISADFDINKRDEYVNFLLKCDQSKISCFFGVGDVTIIIIQNTVIRLDYFTKGDDI